jgi:hypothetical protein
VFAILQWLQHNVETLVELNICNVQNILLECPKYATGLKAGLNGFHNDSLLLFKCPFSTALDLKYLNTIQQRFGQQVNHVIMYSDTLYVRSDWYNTVHLFPSFYTQYLNTNLYMLYPWQQFLYFAALDLMYYQRHIVSRRHDTISLVCEGVVVCDIAADNGTNIVGSKSDTVNGDVAIGDASIDTVVSSGCKSCSGGSSIGSDRIAGDSIFGSDISSVSSDNVMSTTTFAIQNNMFCLCPILTINGPFALNDTTTDNIVAVNNSVCTWMVFDIIVGR